LSTWKDNEGIDIDGHVFLPRWAVDPARVSSVVISSFPFSSNEKGTIRLSGRENEKGWAWTEARQMITALIGREGQFSCVLQAPFPIRAVADGFIKDSNIDVTLTRLQIPFAPIAASLKIGTFHIEDAMLAGDLRIVGPVVDPSFFGTIKVTDFKSKLDLSPNTIEVPTGFLVFEDKEMNLIPVVAETGGIKAEVSAGFVLSRLDLAQFWVAINVQDPKGFAVKTTFGPVELDGHATGQVRIQGTLHTTEITGSIDAFDTTINTVNVPSTTGQASGNAVAQSQSNDLFKLNLKIKSGKNVEFLWPRKDIPILRGSVDHDQIVQVAYQNVPEDLQIDGNVAMRGGEIYYVNRSFFIKDASLQMQERGLVFNPILNAKAELRTYDGSTSYRLSLIVKNQRLMNMNPIVESDPVLSNQKIAILLGTVSSTVSTTGSSLNMGDALYLGSDMFSRFSVIRSIESQIRNFLQVDMFSLRSGVIPNLLRDTVAQSSTPLDNQSTSFGKYFDNTSVLVGKYFGSDVYGEALMQLRNTSSTSQLETSQVESSLLSSSSIGLKLDLDLSMDWHTPFFDLRWDFSPKHPDVLYLSDHTFTFSWRIK